MSSPFPLLRLPGVVLCDVFRSLSIGEKFKLSICSKKISIQINNCRLYSQKVIVDLACLSHKIRVFSENNRDAFEISIYSDSWKSHNSNTQQFSIACCSVKVIPIPKGITTFWKNHREGFLSVIQLLLKVFQCKISINISYYNSDLYQPTIAMLFDLRMEFKTIIFELKGSEDRILLWNQISHKLKLVEDLVILSGLDPGFPPVFASWPQKISIESSAWFSLESLLACTCTTITHRRSHMGNKDLDVILKNWKAGGLPNLKCLRLDSLMITDDGGHILGTTFRELNGMVIQTDDGSKKATIKTNFRNIEIGRYAAGGARGGGTGGSCCSCGVGAYGSQGAPSVPDFCFDCPPESQEGQGDSGNIPPTGNGGRLEADGNPDPVNEVPGQQGAMI